MTISRRIVRARNVHVCCECRHVIYPHERYVRLYGRAFESDPPYVLALCEPCGAKEADHV